VSSGPAGWRRGPTPSKTAVSTAANVVRLGLAGVHFGDPRRVGNPAPFAMDLRRSRDPGDFASPSRKRVATRDRAGCR